MEALEEEGEKKRQRSFKVESGFILSVLRQLVINISFRELSFIILIVCFVFVSTLLCNRFIPLKTIAGFHCHAIKIKIENHSMNEVKKITRCRRYIKRTLSKPQVCAVFRTRVI